MKLKALHISNYRSISTIGFDIAAHQDETYTYGLIGVNEAGKSSILKAISLKSGLPVITTKDFKDKAKDIVLEFTYHLDNDEDVWYQDQLIENAEANVVKKWKELKYTVFYTYEKPSVQTEYVELISEDGKVSIELNDDLFDDGEIHNCVFWTAEDKYLISQPINLSAFAANPESISIPLRNCFLLSGIADIKKSIDNLGSDSTEIEHLQETLGEKVTEHIQAVWPDHPITITFLITNGLIHFHIKDGNASKAKTADQRSDGFKQFVCTSQGHR